MRQWLGRTLWMSPSILYAAVFSLNSPCQTLCWQADGWLYHSGLQFLWVPGAIKWFSLVILLTSVFSPDVGVVWIWSTTSGKQSSVNWGCCGKWRIKWQLEFTVNVKILHSCFPPYKQAKKKKIIGGLNLCNSSSLRNIQITIKGTELPSTCYHGMMN